MNKRYKRGAFAIVSHVYTHGQVLHFQMFSSSTSIIFLRKINCAQDFHLG